MATLLRFAFVTILVLAASVTPVRASGDGAAGTQTSPPALCPYPPPCGDKCSNTPFVPTDCWTTQYGPAKADVVITENAKLGAVRSTNMLYCSSGSYALCFFSGPPFPTGKNCQPGSKNCTNKPLPCVLDGDHANCTCQYYTADATHSYFVDINGILNRGAYQQAVQACGQDGSGCANLKICGPHGKDPRCKKKQQAPVCAYVQNQSPTNASGSLMPDAEVISTFSFAMNSSYKLGSVPCSGLYAGCMTAPCKFPAGSSPTHSAGDSVQCACPTYSGTYQEGQPNQNCPIPSDPNGSYVWSASNTVVEPRQRPKQ